MSRTVDERIASLAKRVQDSDTSVEYDKGPVFDLMIRPVGQELGDAEDRAEYISNLYTSAFSSVADDREILALETNFAMSGQGDGKSSRTKLQYFYRFARPQVGETFIVPEGLLVSNSDRSKIYKTLETITLDGQYADTYYNSSEGWYGVPVLCEATAIGSDYDLKRGRVGSILTADEFWDGTINLGDYAGGEASESSTQKVERIQKRFEGMDNGTYGGIESAVINYNAAVIKNARLVDPSNSKIFRRSTIRPALDLYLIGQNIIATSDAFIATAGQITYILLNQPVTIVTSVTKNGIAYSDWQYEKDIGVLKQSAKSQDNITFNTPLSVGDSIVISYQYDEIISNVQNTLFPSTNNLLFRTDTLTRQAWEAPLSISITFSFVGSVSLEIGEQNLINELYKLINIYNFVDSLNPETIRSQLKSNVVGLGELYFVKFTKTVGSLSDVEIVTFEDNEYPMIDENNLIMSPMR